MKTDPTTASLYTIVLLIPVSFFNYLDRMVLAVLTEPIKHDLHLSDTGIGLISGVAFGVLFALAGLPLARVADRASRVRLLAASLAVWSAFTASAGLARNFAQLFIARVGVGVGEAGCIPAAHSMIGDLYSPARRAFAVSIFQAGGLAGLSAGLFLTGVLYDHIGWRLALASVSLPGLPLALMLLLTVREPARRGSSVIAHESAWTAIGVLLHRPAFTHLMLAFSIASFGVYGLLQWLPAFFVRTYHMSLSRIGLWYGLTIGIASVTGTLAGGVWCARLMRRDLRWELWWPGLAYGLGGVIYVGALCSPTWPAAIALLGIGAFSATAGGGVALSAIQSFAEPRRRATAVALVLFLAAVIGQGGGPLAVGALSDQLTPGLHADGLRFSLFISCAALLWSAIHFTLSARSAARDRVPAEPLAAR